MVDGTDKPATEEQLRFIAERWPMFVGLLEADKIDADLATFTIGLTEREAEYLIGRLRRVIRETERGLYNQMGKRVCETCKWRPVEGEIHACEMPSMLGKGDKCPCWAPDPIALPRSYESFRASILGRRCKVRMRGKEDVVGRPIDYLPGEGMLVKMEPDGEIEIFLFRSGLMVEVLE